MLAGSGGSQILLRAACASLLTYPPKPPPAGYRLVPDLAAGQPRISNGARTYTFTIRRGRRFGVTGKFVTPRDVAQTFNRALDPRFKSPKGELTGLAGTLSDIKGADAVLADRARRAKGVVVRGRKVILRLASFDHPYFLQAAATLCILPAGLPVDPEGARAPLRTAGPYTITAYSPGRSITLRRNRFYSGPFPARVERIVARLTDEGSIVDRVRRGEFDWGAPRPFKLADRARQRESQYGINKRRFFVTPGTFLRLLVLNASRPLFHNNADLRRAVNNAVDRQGLLKARGYRAGNLTDQYLPPSFPGFRPAHIYRLGRPNLTEARRLAKGHTKSRKVVFYGPALALGEATAQILTRNLAAIGLDVEVKLWPPEDLFDRMATPGEPYDIGYIGWSSQPDPALLTFLFHGRGIGREGYGNRSYFNSPRFNRALERAARLTGRARYRAYGALDVELAHDAAPAVAYAYDNMMTIVGPRVPRRCVVLTPGFDILAACLKR